MGAWNERERAQCDRLLQWGLEEDLDGVGDLTSLAVIPESACGRALVVARQEGVIAGLEAVARLARLQGAGVEVDLRATDGPTEADAILAELVGPLRGILGMERLALNMLGRLSGVATMTSRFVAAIAGAKASICDTRKTTPGWRYLEKYAVRVGGGANHRLGLFDGVLIKDNHLAGLAATEERPIAVAIAQARRSAPAGTPVEVEVDTLVQLNEALACRPDIVLLDNMSTENLGLAVEMRDLLAPGVLLEASGGVNLESAPAIARSGVDRVSVGALTHSAPALDVALDYSERAPCD